MAASITQLLLLTQFQVTENPGSEPSGVPLSSLFQGLDQLAQLTPTSTPPVSMFGIYATTISGGTYTIDVTSLQGSNGTLNANGKRLVALAVANPSTSAGYVQIATGASNGYALPQPVKVNIGGFAYQYMAGTLSVVDGTHKTLDITGTTGDTPILGLIFG